MRSIPRASRTAPLSARKPSASWSMQARRTKSNRSSWSISNLRRETRYDRRSKADLPRMLTSRKLLQRKLLDLESDLRGTLRNFGLKVGVVSGGPYEARVRAVRAGFSPLVAIAQAPLHVRQGTRPHVARLRQIMPQTLYHL